jgi:hypothetical protein
MAPTTQPEKHSMASKQQQDKGWLAPSAAKDGDSMNEETLERFQDEEKGKEAVAIQVAVDGTKSTTPMGKDTPYALSFFRSKMALILIAGILVTGVVALTISLLVSKNANSTAADAAGTASSYRENLGIRQEIGELLGGGAQSQELLTSPSSPYAKALEWMIHQDPMQLVPVDSNFFQRYIVVYLYYATTVKGLWRSCNPAVGQEVDFCYRSTFSCGEVYDKTPSTRWLSAVHECQFSGITCNDDMQVQAIHLSKSIVWTAG